MHRFILLGYYIYYHFAILGGILYLHDVIRIWVQVFYLRGHPSKHDLEVGEHNWQERNAIKGYLGKQVTIVSR